MSNFNSAVPGGMNLAGEIQVKNHPDKAVVDASRVRGGAFSVATLADRNAIPTDLRKANVTKCYVVATEKEYVLRSGVANGNWQEITYGGSGGNGEQVFKDTVSRTVSDGVSLTINHDFGPGYAIEKVLFMPDGSRNALQFEYNRDTVTDTQITIEPIVSGSGKLKIIAHAI